MTRIGIDTSVLIALSCRYREIPLLASFDRDFDQLAWLQRIAQPNDLI